MKESGMNTELSQLAILVEEIKKRAAEVLDSSDPRTGLDSLLIESINRAMDEIQRGADPSEFQELAVINLLEKAASAGYATEEIRVFVMALKGAV